MVCMRTIQMNKNKEFYFTTVLIRSRSYLPFCKGQCSAELPGHSRNLVCLQCAAVLENTGVLGAQFLPTEYILRMHPQ